MALIDLIDEDVVKVPLTSTAKTDVIRELTEILYEAGRIDAVEPVYNALLERESLGSTGLERGVAVPHCKTDAIRTLTLAIGIAPQGIDFEAQDGGLSYIFFLMLAAPNKSGPHVEALSEIAKLTNSQAFLKTLKQASTPQEVVELFKE